ncbi:MAG TPA: FHA domain-containing protein [Bdellovibrionota bacterium]|nr:FHA domain-containing protein [Bdellovibrionota bacterium]
MIDTRGQWLLTGIGAPVRGREFVLLGDEIRIGRTPENDIVLPYKSVSRHHACIQRRQDGYWIRDMGSKNGTFLNDRPVEEALLKKSDVLRVGDSSFRVGREESAEASAPTPDLSSILEKIRSLQPAQLKLSLDGLKRFKSRRVLLYGIAAIVGAAVLFSLRPAPNAKSVSTSTGTPSPSASNGKPLRPIRATDDEVLSWRSKIEAALYFDDVKSAVSLLRKVVAARSDDARARAQLDRTEARLRRMIADYYESGAREYEKLYYDRAVSEWRKTMALAADFDPETYRMAEAKIRDAQAKLTERSR